MGPTNSAINAALAYRQLAKLFREEFKMIFARELEIAKEQFCQKSEPT